MSTRELGTAVVTGARRGIGRAIASDLARRGFQVALLDLELSPELHAAAEHAQAHGPRCLALAADIAETQTHERLLDQVEQGLGPIDCLVNNAGVSVMQRGDLLDVSEQSYDRCLNVNTRGTFFLTQSLARRMQARGVVPAGSHRSIINITSINAVAVSISRGEYCVSKATLSMVTLLFGVRLAELGVGVYEVQPGFIETEMTVPAKARYDGEIERGATAIRRWGQPTDVARVVGAMAAGELPYTVGQAIRVDGGLAITKF